jgi:NAD(P)-dependent dehydrogenase (short-subunit alcohol dehydrogenase family)
MPGLLEGKSAVITGAGRGQGRAIARAMAEQGVNIVVNDLGGEIDGTGANHGPADDVVAEIRKAGGTAIASYESVADFTAAERIISSCIDNFGKIDILVNCAGVIAPSRAPFWETWKEDWDTVIAVNLTGTFNTCRHATGYMVKQQKGRIINFSSPAWLGMIAGGYAASKGGVVSFTTALAQQFIMEGYDITCNSLVPIAETRMSPRRGKDYNDRLFRAGLMGLQLYEESSNPPGPEHIPPIVLYLATDQAAGITGQVFGASRGRVALYSRPKEIKGLYKDGVWTLEELERRIPMTLAQDLPNKLG